MPAVSWCHWVSRDLLIYALDDDGNRENLTADFTNNSLLAQFRPVLLHLPTANGEHCTGDAIKMGEAIGAKAIDLEWSRCTRLVLVKPDDPDVQIKFFAAEALRGVGGLVFDALGNRFVNELGRRDYVTENGRDV